MNEKVDSVQLEYTYLLTSQLEQQRRFFEESVEQQAKESARQIEELKEKTRIAVEERKELEGKMGQVIIYLFFNCSCPKGDHVLL